MGELEHALCRRRDSPATFAFSLESPPVWGSIPIPIAGLPFLIYFSTSGSCQGCCHVKGLFTLPVPECELSWTPTIPAMCRPLDHQDPALSFTGAPRKGRWLAPSLAAHEPLPRSRVVRPAIALPRIEALGLEVRLPTSAFIMRVLSFNGRPAAHGLR